MDHLKRIVSNQKEKLFNGLMVNLFVKNPSKHMATTNQH